MSKAADRWLVPLHDFEVEASRRVSEGAWARIQGGAADEVTLRENLEAWRRIRLLPRGLTGVARADTSITLLNQKLPFPILLAPTGAQSLIHPRGDLEVVEGAAEAEAILIISSSASLRVEEVARQAKGTAWFQIYVQRDRGFTRDLVERAEASGCAALCVTIDSPNQGARDREYRLRDTLPARPLPNFASSDYLDPTLTWRDMEWLQSFAKTPLLVKGILNPDDAEIAVKAGISGVIVSNHGGRNLDTAPATAEVLPRVVERIERRVPVIVDGGIRRGTDVLKAIALGANAVAIGRPYLYGLAVNGAEGVAQVVRVLRQELEEAMTAAGCENVGSIGGNALWEG